MLHEIKTYTLTDKEYIIEIFKSNCPKYFDSNDLPDLIDFLDNYADHNFKVLLYKNEIIGCGGYYVNHANKVFGIAWVMFKRFSVGHSNFRKIAALFFNHTLNNIEDEKLDFDIIINTTQLLEKTFNRFDFRTEKIIKKGFGANLDHYVMRRKLKL